MSSNLENCSRFGLFETSCGGYLEKPSSGRSCTLRFFKGRCSQGFETDLELYIDGGKCLHWGRKYDSAKCC